MQITSNLDFKSFVKLDLKQNEVNKVNTLRNTKKKHYNTSKLKFIKEIVRIPQETIKEKLQ